MGFRFRRSIKLLPGVRLNVSKTGVSTSVGRPGATINISKRGVKGTVGLPGSGLSYSERIDGSAPAGSGARLARLLIWAAVAGLVAWLMFGR